MLDDIFYISGIAVNIGLIFTIYKFNKIYLNKNDEIKSLIKNGEEGTPHNLHSSQSVGNLKEIDKEEIDKEEIVKERLRKISNENSVFLRKWINYLQGFTSKNE